MFGTHIGGIWVESNRSGTISAPRPGAALVPWTDRFAAEREAMVERQLRQRGITDERVLAAMGAVPREEFVPELLRVRAYYDGPLPIGDGQTISQPYMVAAMTAALALQGTESVLEVGTGCGYQAAVLSCLARVVETVEFRPALASDAAERLGRLGYRNVTVHTGDGSGGLPEYGPYDAILVAAAAPSVPEPLLSELADGGRLVVPVGTPEEQQLLVIVRSGETFSRQQGEKCRFVPLVGRYGWRNSTL